MISHIKASSSPPPSAKPLTAAMIGFLTDVIYSQSRRWLNENSTSEHGLGIDSREPLVFHLLDVCSRGECLSRPREDDGSVLVVGINRGGSLVKLVE